MDTETELQKKVTKGFFWTAAQTWGARAFSFPITLVLAHLLAPEAFGLVALASVFIAFADIFVQQGFGDAIVQTIHLTEEHLKTAFWASMLIGGLLTVTGILTSGPLAQILRDSRLQPILAWLSLSFLFGALSSVQKAVLRRQLAFKKLATCSLAATIVSSLIAVVLAWQGFGVWSLVAKTLFGGLADTAVLWKVSDWRPGFGFSGAHFRELFAFGGYIVGGHLVEFASRRSDDLLIGYFLGPVALGYYTLAYNLLLMVTDLLTTVPNVVLFPVFSRLQDQLPTMQHWLYESTQIINLVSFPICLGIAALAPDIVPVLYGPQWLSSIPVTQLLVCIGVVHSMSYIFGNVLKALGKPSWRLGILTLIAVANVLGFVLAIRGGIVVVAAVYVAIGYLSAPLYFHLVQKVMGLSFQTYAEQYRCAVICTLVMLAVVLGLRYGLMGEATLLVRLLVCGLAGVATYLLALYLIKPALYRRVWKLGRLALPTAESNET